MLDFTWKIFSSTGDINTYLLFKELEKEHPDSPDLEDDDLAELDFPIL
ncbi:YqzL family protein [Bacillus lacus]|uniref:YqzL family protein n=1 Tax=Metabacillus lacus TaxID=1983721 RepID=A0A7X2LXH7_9BACI|nr:YqzL family protein [Metabacillus lacus]MRX71301.1 YqzL family protein [Metabacillus lacus]